MVFLIASIAVLGVGPLAHRWLTLSEKPLARTVLDLVVIAAIAGIVLINILPHSIETAGWRALVLLVLGLLVPTGLELWLRRRASSTHLFVGAVVVTGISLHALIDGMALGVTNAHHEYAAHGLPWAVVLHRMPVGLILWWLVRPRFGARAAFLVLGIIAVATCVGYLAGGMLSGMESIELALFQAFAAGALLHVAVHQRDAHPHH